MPPKDVLNEQVDFNGWFSRAAKAVPSTFKKEGKSTVVEAVITTEQPAMVVDWERWEIVREILLMDGVVMPDTKQLPLLNSHSRYSTSSVRGSIRNLRVEDDKLVGDVHFWSKAEDEISQVEEGHLTDLSAGYKTFKDHTIEVFPGETKELPNGKKIENNYGDKIRLLVRTKWEVKEGSLVAIGADSASKFRSEQQGKITGKSDLETKLEDALTEIKNINIKLNERTSTMPPKEGDAPEKTQEQIRKEERERQVSIEAIASKFENHYKGGKDALRKAAADAINDGKSADEFRAHVFDNYQNTGPLETPLGNLDAEKAEMEKYSISKAIHNLAAGNFAGTREAKMSAAIADKIGKGARSANSFFIPDDFWRSFSKRVLATTSPTAGGNLVGTDHLGSSFVEMLRNKSALGRAGISMLTGLKENIQIPKQTGAASFEMVTEGNAATGADLTVGQITMQPHIGSANTSYTKTLLIQSNPSIDRLVIDDLLKVAALGVDYYGLRGDGVTSEPLGLLNITGTGDPDGASIDWPKLVAFETAIENDNADVNTMKWLTNPAVKGVLKTRKKDAGSGLFLMEQNGEANGYGSVISNQVPAEHLILGCFDQFWLAEWGVTEITVDPFYYSTAGIVRVTVFVHFDVAVRHAESFAIADDVT